MKDIRLTTLAKIIIPIFLVFAVVIIVIFVFYQSAIQEENEFLNATIESFGVTLSPHVTVRLTDVQARSATLYITLTCVIGVFVLVALLSLLMVTYKLMPLRKLVSVATELAKGDIENNDLNIPKDELGDLTKKLAYKIKATDENLSILESALEKANAASKAKGEFLSNMSHEIRTPTNAIIGMTNIAKSADSIERKDYALGRIGDASNHLLSIINDILDMSKIEADKLELHEEDFDFEDMLKKVINIINFRVVEKNQKLTVYIDDKIPHTLVADDQRLSQVLTNLLSNAGKFTPENGEINLNTKLLEEDACSCVIQFEIIDNGVGISEEQKVKLFRPFEQAESSTTRKYGGTGLGLTIAKRIIELMGGEISVSSEIGEGSIFTFTINAKKATVTEKGVIPKGGVDIDNMRILVIDDDEDIREYFVDIASRFNIACDAVASGEEALERMRHEKYDMSFIDWKMPGMDGIELTRRIKEMDSDKSVTIMISSAQWQDIAEEVKVVGVDKFLPKPIFPSTFIECFNQYFCADLLGEEKKDKSENTDRFEGYRLLLAEDVDINREIVISLLEPTLLEIDCAENGVEAVRMFSEAPDRYNIVFMDLQMPEMDGFDATRSIRMIANEKAKSIPIIAMTANVFKEDVENCLAAGMNDHIGKPLDFEKVLQILRRYLYRQKPARERRKKERRQSKSDRRQHLDRRQIDRRQK